MKSLQLNVAMMTLSGGLLLLALAGTFTTYVEGAEDDSQCSCGAGIRCACVPYYLCEENGTVISTGKGVIDIRIQSTCPQYLDVCCKLGDQSSPTGSTSSPRQDDGNIRCGQRGERGIGPMSGAEGTRETEAQFGEFPWMAAFFKDGTYQCGGAIIAPNVVLTGTFCVENTNATEFQVRAGEHNLKDTDEAMAHQERAVKNIILYPDYKQVARNALALVVLEEPLSFGGHIGPICLPEGTQALSAEDCVLSHWGQNSHDNVTFHEALRRITMPLVSRQDCQTKLRTTRVNRFFLLDPSLTCAGTAEGDLQNDVCWVNGGSPLSCPSADNDRYSLRGLMAWRLDCGVKNVPGVFVNIPFFRQWIDDQLRELNVDITMYYA